MGIGIITSVALHPLRAFARASPFSRQSRYGIDQPKQLGDVISVGGGEHQGQRHPLGLNDDMVLAATFAPVHGAGTGFAPSVRRPNRGAVHDGAFPVDFAFASQFTQQFDQQTFPYPPPPAATF
jgi:hypothetical protein